jgi:hypothetical protein
LTEAAAAGDAAATATARTALATLAATEERRHAAAARVALELHDLFDGGLEGFHFIVAGAEGFLEVVHHALTHLSGVEALALGLVGVGLLRLLGLLGLGEGRGGQGAEAKDGGGEERFGCGARHGELLER